MTDEPTRDIQTVGSDGADLTKLPEGVTFRDVPMHIDARGSVRELYDLRWHWHPDPLVYSYCFTVRPGYIKGWALHKLHDDRYIVLSGALEVVLYDERMDSSTRGLVTSVVLSEFRGRLLSIPAGVWHADRNIGDKDVIAINFPTQPYDHANPDKYRLPLNNDRIPHKFDQPQGF